MTHPTNLREAYPDDKLLRFLFLPSEYPILSIVLLAAATIGLMIRSAITKVYFYGLGAGVIVGFVWMLVMVFYGTYLQHKYIKHQRMLSGSRTTVRDDK